MAANPDLEIHAIERRSARESGKTRITRREGLDDKRDRSISAQTAQSKRAEEVDDVPEHDGLLDHRATSETADPSLHAGIVADDFVGGWVVALARLHRVDHCLGSHVQEWGEGVGELDDTDRADDAD